MNRGGWLLLVGLGLSGATAARAALGGESLLTDQSVPGAFTLAGQKHAAPLFVSAEDWLGVRRAAGDLQADIERVTALKPELSTGESPAGHGVILIGTIGKSPLIDGLVGSGKLDVTGLRGEWESFVLQVVEAPAPGVDRALVIAGSDKRGTIYGIYELSQQIGVSPWYWWADVTPLHRDELLLKPGRYVTHAPSVKYRGIFLNDEAPDLTNWIRAKFGNVSKQANPRAVPDAANYGHEFYTKLFEVMLRLRANYLWPAMWNNAFNEDDPENARLADEYGIVMGTSHQEPMLRAQKEWDWRYEKTLGKWNYAREPDALQQFWREGVRRNRSYESIVTLGLRGANDTEMAPGGPDANRALLEKIVDVQRGILRDEMNPDLAQVPQVWCLYKEVQEYYEHGMRVPDDVTLLWAEDNWGNLRRLPTAAERLRRGGAGVYYHFDYHGDPRSYQWLNTNPLPKIWEQMSMAKTYGADRIWIVNVGHFKGYELPMEYFLSLGWDTTRWTGDNTGEFTRTWATREFGTEHASDIADLVTRLAKFNGRRKPEMLAPDTYSLTDYREAETVVADFQALASRAEQMARELPAAKLDAFYQLVLFPVQASALVNELYLEAGRNALYAKQGRASANDAAADTQALFQRYLAMTAHYNRDLAGGKWAHFMDQPVLGYTSWRDPPVNNLDHLKLVKVVVPEAASMGVAVEGSESAVGSGAVSLPRFDVLNRQQRYVEIFRKGGVPFDFTAIADKPWIVLSASHGTATGDQRISVSVDWSKVPGPASSGTVKISGAGAEVMVQIEAFNPAQPTRESLEGFVETDGYVAIEPEHFTGGTAAGANHWFRIADYGRTLSGMKAYAPVDAPSAVPGKDSPCLEYRMYLFNGGAAEVTAITAPTMNFVPDRGLRYAVSFDDETPQVVTLVPQGFQAQARNPVWAKAVGDNAHYGRSQHLLASPGYHTLKIWMIDPAVVLQKLVVDLGGVRPSYLGPPESLRNPVARADQPLMRADHNSQLAHAQLLAKARSGGIGVYFIGDSITRRWGATDYPDFLAHWRENFHGWNAADFGWGADQTQNMLWRLDQGELEGVNPKVIVILAGTNNVGNTPRGADRVADTTAGIAAIVQRCRAKAPAATIILMGIFPRGDHPELMPAIHRINANLARLADGKTVRYLDLTDRLTGADGQLLPGVTLDGLHPNLKGYAIWADALKPLLTELLGPPAATDTAPPPTGDPSAPALRLPSS
jgi:lysophospholipase L1-like esterase